MSVLVDASAKVLANRGIPVRVNKLRVIADELVVPYEVVGDHKGAPEREERFVRLSNMTIADLEEQYDGLAKWEDALRQKPFDTIVRTLSIVWADDETPLPRRQVGAMLIDGSIDDYATAIGGAFLLANGSDASAVGKVLKQGVVAAAKVRERMAARVERAEKLAAEETATPGESGSGAGADLVALSTSSGD